MIKRTLGPCIPEVKQTAYNMLIRPKLEYSSPIWNPHTTSQIKSLERVQHSAARFVKNDYRRNTNPADNNNNNNNTAFLKALLPTIWISALYMV